MTSREIKHKVKEFVKEYQLQELNAASLCLVMEQQGYTIVKYNHIENESDVSELVDALGLREMVERSKGFTYADLNFRAVFLHEDLSEKEKLMVLAHEEGHIYCGHLSSVPIIGRDVQEEYEANEFAHYLLHSSLARRTMNRRKGNKRLTYAAAAAAAMLLLISAFLVFRKSNRPVYADFYVTETGFKYHKRDCIFVKGKDNARPITESEYYSGEYRPCGVCMPED